MNVRVREAREVELVAVAPEAQGAGVGGALLEVAASDARRAGLPVLRLRVDVPTGEDLDRWSRRGFGEAGRLHGRGSDRVLLERPVA